MCVVYIYGGISHHFNAWFRCVVVVYGNKIFWSFISFLFSFFFTLKSCPWALLCSLPLFHILQQIYIIDKKILFSEFNLHICWKVHILVRGYFWWFFFCNSKNFTHLRIIMIISWKKTHFINNLLAFNFFCQTQHVIFFHQSQTQ